MSESRVTIVISKYEFMVDIVVDALETLLKTYSRPLCTLW